MAIKYAIEKHAVAAPSRVLASKYGANIFNILLKEDTDNGAFVGKGNFKELDLYEEAAPTAATGKVVAKAANGNYYVEILTAENAFFVYNAPVIEEQYNKTFAKEENFFNANGEVVRGYEVKPYDIVELSAEGFTVAVEVGDAVSLKTVSGKTYCKKFGK